jgi:hypothetical protein
MAPVASDLMEPSPWAIHEALGFPATGGISIVSWSIVELYPYCPEGVRKAYRDSFRSAEPQKLKLDLDEPVVQGTFASVKGKRNPVWIIEFLEHVYDDSCAAGR